MSNGLTVAPRYMVTAMKRFPASDDRDEHSFLYVDKVEVPMKPDVSIIIASYNTRYLLVTCLRSIAATRGNVRLEVIVVDNASTDGSVSALGEFTARATKFSENVRAANDL